ncbi:MAG: hypothetical protein WCY41_03620 [Candidatus Micrarchaeia archaeon]
MQMRNVRNRVVLAAVLGLAALPLFYSCKKESIENILREKEMRVADTTHWKNEKAAFDSSKALGAPKKRADSAVVKKDTGALPNMLLKEKPLVSAPGSD